MFLHHVVNLPIGSLGRDIHDLQEHVGAIGISDLKSVSKRYWKKVTNKYVISLNRNNILNSIKNMKKLSHEEFSNETFVRKQYFFDLDLSSVRYRFRISSKMLDVRANFPRKFRPLGMECPSCKQTNTTNNIATESEAMPPETQDHVKNDCAAFDEIRSHYDLSEDDQLVHFFQEALALRDRLGNDEELYDE